MASSLFLKKVTNALWRKAEAVIGRLIPISATLQSMENRPFELHLELTNICNANCIFCPYQYQTRPQETMSDEVFDKALSDYVASGGGDVFLTPIVGDVLIDRKFLERVRKIRSHPEIDRIKMITNTILVDRYGAEEIITSGVTHLGVSIAGFDEGMYERVYRSKQYKRVFKNVLALLEANEKLGRPVAFEIGLRPDRDLDEVMNYPDFQKILSYEPELDFTWAFTNAGGRIKREDLPPVMKLRAAPRKSEPCVNLLNGPIVLPDGTALACSCVAAMDAVEDLGIGNVLKEDIGDIWRSQKMKDIRQSFGTEKLNKTCQGCEMYRNLDFYRTRLGRLRAETNDLRGSGALINRETSGKGVFRES